MNRFIGKSMYLLKNNVMQNTKYIINNELLIFKRYLYSNSIIYSQHNKNCSRYLLLLKQNHIYNIHNIIIEIINNESYIFKNVRIKFTRFLSFAGKYNFTCPNYNTIVGTDSHPN